MASYRPFEERLNCTALYSRTARRCRRDLTTPPPTQPGRYARHLVMAINSYLSFDTVFHVPDVSGISHMPSEEKLGTVKFELPQASPSADMQLG
jgi:hypothetical protein